MAALPFPSAEKLRPAVGWPSGSRLCATLKRFTKRSTASWWATCHRPSRTAFLTCWAESRAVDAAGWPKGGAART